MAAADRRKIDLGPTGKAVATKVRRLREAHGLTVAELSGLLEKVGRPLAPISLTRLEAGARRVDVDDLMALAVVLDVPLSSLLLPDGEEVTVTASGRINRRAATMRLGLESQSRTARRALAHAQETANKMVIDAKEEADRLLHDARQRADTIDVTIKAKVTEIEMEARRRANQVEAEATRLKQQVFDQLEAELGQLERQRDQLRDFEREYLRRLIVLVTDTPSPTINESWQEFRDRALEWLRDQLHASETAYPPFGREPSQ